MRPFSFTSRINLLVTSDLSLIILFLLTHWLFAVCILQAWGLAIEPLAGAPGDWQGCPPYVLLPPPPPRPGLSFAVWGGCANYVYLERIGNGEMGYPRSTVRLNSMLNWKLNYKESSLHIQIWEESSPFQSSPYIFYYFQLCTSVPLHLILLIEDRVSVQFIIVPPQIS